MYFYGARWYDPYLGRWIQPDSIIPGGVQGLDRYAYTFNNPLKYSDPSGHLPDWLDNALDYAQGAAYQFTNDMTFGFVENIATAMNLCVDCNRSEAFYEGQQGGRVASTVVSSTEAVLGTAAAAEGLAAMGPTAGGGLLCGAVTAGGCIVVAGVGLTAEGTMVLGGTAVAGLGSATYVYIQGNPIQQHHPWPEYLLGPNNQKLYGLSKELHVEYHRQLDAILSRQFGKDYYQQMLKSPGRLNEVLEYLRDFNRYFDDTYGTHTYEALEEVLRSERLIPK